MDEEIKVPKEVIEGLIFEWQKPNVSKEKRAIVLKSFRKKFNISQRRFEELYKVPKGTLHDWENPEVRDNRRTNEEVKLRSLLTSLKNIKNPDISLKNVIKDIKKEIDRLEHLIIYRTTNI